ncbi:MAG TPA: tripartite tricarboxylate transporter substrate binding protein [Acetobacteraceae bacterium]|nr:tripartite tricarboxylate transporter substrate binding protein [Acetobacteraceae bacterium]
MVDRATGQWASGTAIQVVVAFPAGGPSDLTARLMQSELARLLGTSVVVRNLPGAAGTIGTAEVARARPDGTTLVLSPIAPVSLMPHLRPLPYAPLRDLAPICQVSETPTLLVVKPDGPYRELDDLIATARARRRAMTFGSGGHGTMPHIAGVALGRAFGLELLHVPFRGAAESGQAIIAGTVDFTVEQPILARQFGLRPLLIFAETRSPDFPEVPTAREREHELLFSVWNGLFAPAGMPTELLRRLEAACRIALTTAPVIEGMARLNTPIRFRGASDFASYLAEEHGRMGRLISEGGIRLAE